MLPLPLHNDILWVVNATQELSPRESMNQLIQHNMRISIKLQVERYLRTTKGPIPSDAGQLIQRAIFNKCSESSVDTLLLLRFAHPGTFKRLFLLGSYVQQAWNRHVIFVAQDVKQLWYYASPSIISPYWYTSPATHYEEAINHSPYPQVQQKGSLNELLHTIQAEQPGEWPTANQVQVLLSHSVHLPYQTSDHSQLVSLWEIQHLPVGTKAIERQVTVLPDVISHLGQAISINPNIGYVRTMMDD